MPVNWNAETEARLLAGLFKVCEIKVSGQQLKELAEIIGPDCTAKAITHRLAKFRTQAGTFHAGSKGKETGEAETPTKKRGRPSKKAAKSNDDAKIDSEDEENTKVKKHKKDSDSDGEEDVFKDEVAEDE